jgi:hypothetical protein
MDDRLGGVRRVVGAALLAFGLASCGPGVDVGSLPAPEQTLTSAGKRLSGTLSVADLSAIARRGDRVLASLTRAERDALARGLVRFRVDRPVEVLVAYPRGSAPFWLTDQGFRPAGISLRDPELTWEVTCKSFAPGWVGLGVNGLDRTPPAHYAVLLRSPSGGPVQPQGFDGNVWELTRLTEGVALETGTSRPVTGVPPGLVGAMLLRAPHDRRHAALLARGRVWKSHVPSTRAPDQVTISFGPDPSSELVWSWRTGPDVENSVVRVRAAGTAAAVREVQGRAETVEMPDLLNDPVIKRHTVRLSGLEAGTRYEYSLGDGTPQGMTPWTEIRTAPRGPSDVCLLYMGDPQCGLEGWGKLLSQAYRHRPDAGAVLIAGDLVDRGNERTNWDHFFLRAAGVFERLPVMPAVGNHEYLDRGPKLFRAYFALPANGPAGIECDLAYSFEYGDAFVAVLDSTLAVSDPSKAEVQAQWLDAQLSRTRRAWKLVMFHHPVYASHPWRESPALRDAWVPVFDRHHVDLVLQGHDHAYLRTYPMRGGRRVASPADGTVYVVSVSGDKYCDQNPRGYAEVNFTHVSTYQTIDVLPQLGRLVYRSFDRSGREVDGFTIDKPGTGRRLTRR